MMMILFSADSETVKLLHGSNRVSTPKETLLHKKCSCAYLFIYFLNGSNPDLLGIAFS